MMETQRPHRSGSSSSELFICFTARPSLSSSSMKISSKSIHSPARSDKLRESTLSLSSSLSRRLRSNGSMKGGQASPMFPTGNKKRGSFENPEPSSPKVTCIGQVRVKKKKQGKKMRTRSTRRGEASFRDGIQQQQQQHQECLPHRNQRWVHIPLSICETLRAFGSEFNCFLPCRSPCASANEREKEEKEEEKTRTNTTSSNSCDAVFARWLMAIQEGHEEKGAEIALMVGEEETREKTEAVEGNVMEIDEKGGVKEEIEDEEGGRVSICIPPRNALLLMRCRSEPFRVSALSNRFWDSPATKENEHADGDDEEDSEDDEGQMAEAEQEVGEEDEDNDGEDENVDEVQIECDEKQEEEEMANVPLGEPLNLQENVEDSEMQGNPETTTTESVKSEENPGIGVEDAYEREGQHDDSQMEHTDEQIMESGSSAEPVVVEVEKSEINVNEAEPETISPDPVAEEEEEEEEAETEEEGRRTSSVSSSSSASAMPVETTRVEREGEQPEQEIAELAEAAQVDLEERMEESKEEKEPGDAAQETNEIAIETEETKEEMRAVESSQNQQQQTQDQIHEDQSKEGQVEEEKEKSEDRESSSKLPDCLLLMMFEPKLSMEVSKETWVSSTDFIRCRPEKPPLIAKKGGDEAAKKVSTDLNPTQQQKQLQQHQPEQQQLQQQQQQQAARKSFSNLPTAAVAEPPSTAVPPSMAAMIEQKLVNAKAYEPFVLTRCKSEPVRSSVKLAPEACFWKNRRLEPHRPTGQAGLGF